MSYGIPDDPIIRSMERTGLPPWLLYGDTEDIIDADFEENTEKEGDQE